MPELLQHSLATHTATQTTTLRGKRHHSDVTWSAWRVTSHATDGLSKRCRMDDAIKKPDADMGCYWKNTVTSPVPVHRDVTNNTVMSSLPRPCCCTSHVSQERVNRSPGGSTSRYKHQLRCNCGLTVYRSKNTAQQQQQQQRHYHHRQQQQQQQPQQQQQQQESSAQHLTTNLHSPVSATTPGISPGSLQSPGSTSFFTYQQFVTPSPHTQTDDVTDQLTVLSPLSRCHSDTDSDVTMETLSSQVSQLDVTSAIQRQRPVDVLKPMALGRKKFNLNPSEGLKYLWEQSLVGRTPQDVAHFLYKTDGLSRNAIGEFLGEKNEFNIETLKEFVNLHNFKDIDIVGALRVFLASFHLPGEAQKIDRMMECFAQHYCHLNPHVFHNTDVCYVLSFSIIMLNTSLHNPRVKERMSLETFVAINRTPAAGSAHQPPGSAHQPLSSEFLSDLYSSIKHEPFKVPEVLSDIDDIFDAFIDPVKQGWLCKRGGRYKSWKLRWFILKDNCLYYFTSQTDQTPKGILPLENLQLRDVIDRHKPHCFELYSPVSDVIKACKTASSGQVVPGNHRVFRMSAATSDEQLQWAQTIRASTCSDSPIQLQMFTARHWRQGQGHQT